MVSSKKDMIENLSMDVGFSGRKKSSVLRLALCGGDNPQRGLWMVGMAAWYCYNR